MKLFPGFPSPALAEAHQAEAEIAAGQIKGPLHGAPIAVKDLCWMEDVPTAAGMTIHRDYKPTEDATVVRGLRDAGAIILGKLQLTEGAYVDHHPKITPPVNPWGAEYWSGASSSGSGVATAAGLFVAVTAVVFFNYFKTRIKAYNQEMIVAANQLAEMLHFHNTGTPRADALAATRRLSSIGASTKIARVFGPIALRQSRGRSGSARYPYGARVHGSICPLCSL